MRTRLNPLLHPSRNTNEKLTQQYTFVALQKYHYQIFLPWDRYTRTGKWGFRLTSTKPGALETLAKVFSVGFYTSLWACFPKKLWNSKLSRCLFTVFMMIKVRPPNRTELRFEEEQSNKPWLPIKPVTEYLLKIIDTEIEKEPTNFQCFVEPYKIT